MDQKHVEKEVTVGTFKEPDFLQLIETMDLWEI